MSLPPDEYSLTEVLVLIKKDAFSVFLGLGVRSESSSESLTIVVLEVLSNEPKMSVGLFEIVFSRLNVSCFFSYSINDFTVCTCCASVL